MWTILIINKNSLLALTITGLSLKKHLQRGSSSLDNNPGKVIFKCTITAYTSNNKYRDITYKTLTYNWEQAKLLAHTTFYYTVELCGK